jgi:colanic acid/amylovoran biosynthesis glycosyltransferase
VVSTYGFDATVMARRARWRQAYGELARRAAAIVVEGPHMAQTVALLGFDPAAIHVVPIAAALASIPFRIPRFEGDGVRLITCGRLVPKKGHALAIEGFAAAELPPNSTLTIVGDGPLRHSLEALVARLGLRREVTFAGALSRPDWVAALAQHDLFVAPSITAPNGDQEGGAPTTILDAQAAGVPVVGSTHADIPFLVADGVTGYLFPEGSVVGLSGALRQAVSGQAIWPRIAGAARDQVMARHTDEAAARLLRAIHAGAARR